MKTKTHLPSRFGIALFLLLFIASPLFAQRPDKVQQMKDRRAAEGATKVDKNLTEALALAKKGDLGSWKTAKNKIAEARGALKKLESSAATRDNAETKRYRSTMTKRVSDIYMAANGWLPGKITTKPRADVYRGGDKEKMRGMIKTAWMKQWPTDKLVAIRFDRADWIHDVEKSGNRIIKDFQIMEATAYVKESPGIVTGYPAYFNRDNLTKKENAGVYTKTAEYISHDVRASDL